MCVLAFSLIYNKNTTDVFWRALNLILTTKVVNLIPFKRFHENNFSKCRLKLNRLAMRLNLYSEISKNHIQFLHVMSSYH